MDANNSLANLEEGAEGEKGGCLHSPKEGKRGGRRGPKPKKQFPGRKEVRLALGQQRAHGQVCIWRKVVISTIVRKWDCGRGPPGALESAECGEGPRRPGELGHREGRESRPALPPFVPSRGGCLSRCLLCGLLALALPRLRRRSAGARARGKREMEGGRSSGSRLGSCCPPLPAEPQWRRKDVKNKIKIKTKIKQGKRM